VTPAQREITRTSDAEWLEKVSEMKFVMPNRSAVVVKNKYRQYLFLDAERGKWWRTNDVGKEIMDLWCGKLTVGQIIDRLSHEYSLDREVIIKMTVPFLRKAIEREYVLLGDGTRDKSTMDKKEISSRIQMLWIEVTQRCQLHCPYCYAEDSKQKPNMKELTLDEYALLMSDPVAREAKQIVVSGGEPTLRSDIIEILKLFRSTGNTVSFVSNGVIQDFNLWKEISNYVDSIQISIDGPNAEIHERLRGEGNFAKAVSTLKFLSETKLKHLHVAFTPTDLNVGYLPQMMLGRVYCM
jgi:uncharacterized radical SAM superfamily Fe-S cluster-containing enzyme